LAFAAVGLGREFSRWNPIGGIALGANDVQVLSHGFLATNPTKACEAKKEFIFKAR
jgi:hypothetical protein